MMKEKNYLEKLRSLLQVSPFFHSVIG